PRHRPAQRPMAYRRRAGLRRQAARRLPGAGYRRTSGGAGRCGPRDRAAAHRGRADRGRGASAVRLFVAIFPPAEAVTDLKSVVDRMHLSAAAAARRRVHLDPPELWHVTLAFLGEVAPQRVPAIKALLGDIVDAWARDNVTRPPLALADGGRFGSGPS